MSLQSLPKILVIVGPTASGKSSLATELAKKINGEILCVDSRTVYRGMDIGTAKDFGGGVGGVNPPSLGYGGHWALRLYGLDLVDPNQEMNGALFKEYAEKTIAEILSRGHLPILVGGTGLWVDMIVDNLEMPDVKPDLELRAELEKRSEEELFAEFSKLDPVGATAIDSKNKRRLIRALEVCKKTGRPFSELRKKGEGKYDVLWLGMNWPKEILDERINARVDQMIKDGLVDEVKQLKEKYGCDIYSMSGIGYQEICWYLSAVETQNFASLDTAINEIKKNTRQYAKRQKTWFKRNKKIHWIKDLSEAVGLIDSWLK